MSINRMPSTETVRRIYVAEVLGHTLYPMERAADRQSADEAFDRWLAEHDRAVRRDLTTALDLADVAPFHVIQWLREHEGAPVQNALILGDVARRPKFPETQGS